MAIKNIIFDFGRVLVDWLPRKVYVDYFGSEEKAYWFVHTICTAEWNNLADLGYPLAQITEDKVKEFPEWEKEIRMYYDRWPEMITGEIPGSLELMKDLKAAGYKLYGLSNWSAELFPIVKDRYPCFSLLDGYLISGEVRMVKPDHAYYQLLLDKFNLKAEECVFLDDNAANIVASEEMGIKGILFKSAGQAREELEKIL